MTRQSETPYHRANVNVHIGAIALLVRDYDEAIAYYTEKLRFRLVEDIPQPGSAKKRWVRLRPSGNAQCDLILARASDARQESRIGNQTGGRVFLFLHTDDFWRDYAAMKERGVEFTEEPRTEAYGHVVVFRDLYGNRWDLIEEQPK